jgi:Uma2 family endonuclease
MELASMPDLPMLHRLTVDEYERIVAAGALDDTRCELVDGLLVAKAPKSPEHDWTVATLRKAMETQLPSDWTERQGDPVRIPLYDEPEPDIAIVRGSNDDYKHRHPTPAEVTFLVEVSESSLALDRSLKLSAYAKSRIPVYWIINLVDRQVEVYSRPGPAGYQSLQVHFAGSVVPVVIDGQSCAPIAVDDILP